MTPAGWRAVYTIASERNATKRGHGHLSDHAHEILTLRTQYDNYIMTAAMMNATFGFTTR